MYQISGDDWEVAGLAGWDVQIPTHDESIMRRRRALAPIQVLTDIERTKSSLDGEHWVHYDLFTLALAVIDQVALAMGISAGRTWDEALDYGAQQAARQRPDGDHAEWAAVAERVVVSLVTTEIEVATYLMHTPTGPVWRQQRFRLLYLHPVGSEAVEHLRASEQAINIFVEALDLDIEAAQIANEAQLTALIARGAVESAVQIARHARYRSIQYLERIRRIIADTLIDPDVHDWVDEVPALLEAALEHVKARLDAGTRVVTGTVMEWKDGRRQPAHAMRSTTNMHRAWYLFHTGAGLLASMTYRSSSTEDACRTGTSTPRWVISSLETRARRV